MEAIFHLSMNRVGKQGRAGELRRKFGIFGQIQAGYLSGDCTDLFPEPLVQQRHDGAPSGCIFYNLNLSMF